jgi:hypothetical protein
MNIGLMYRFDTKRNDLFLDLKEAKANHKARRGGEADTCYLNINDVKDEDKKKFIADVIKSLNLNIVFTKDTLKSHLWIGVDSEK